MASHSVEFSKHATLSAATVDTITFTGGTPDRIEILNRSTSDTIYASIDTPTVAGDNTYVVAGGQALVVEGSPSIKLISSGAAAYSVSRVDV